MRRDYLKQIRECASIPCRFSIQIGHSQHYRGKYNGPYWEPLTEVLITKTIPMRKLMVGTWGGPVDGHLIGIVSTCSRFDRQVYFLDRGRYWRRGQEPTE